MSKNMQKIVRLSALMVSSTCLCAFAPSGETYDGITMRIGGNRIELLTGNIKLIYDTARNRYWGYQGQEPLDPQRAQKWFNETYGAFAQAKSKTEEIKAHQRPELMQ